jgi:hypothetical protein
MIRHRASASSPEGAEWDSPGQRLGLSHSAPSGLKVDYYCPCTFGGLPTVRMMSSGAGSSRRPDSSPATMRTISLP